MKLARSIAILIVLTLLLIVNVRQPVHAFSCQQDCANAQSTCNNTVDATYQQCVSDCDTLYPWWSGCPIACWDAREGGWAQCESDYNACVAGCP